METVLITGAASGIGLATAQRLAARLHVVIADRNIAGAEAAVRQLREAGRAATAIGVDVTDAGAVEDMMKTVTRGVGPVHALFCNAGISPKTAFEDITEAEWDHVIDTHVKGVFLCTRAVLPQMCERRAGAVVTMASDYAVRGMPNGAAYAAAKTTIYSLTKSLALEFAPFGIRCNSVGPGPIETPLLRRGRSDEEWQRAKAARAAQVPMGRLGQPSEVAAVVDFLLSERASYITGQIIHPNGGQISW